MPPLTNLAVVAFGVSSALSWGAADFSGGLASRRTAAIGVVLGGQAIGLVIGLALAFASREPLPASVDYAWAAAASLSGTLALVTFYRALAIGRMSVVATVGAVVSASFPLVVGALVEGLPSLVQAAGMVIGIVAIGLVTLAADDAGRDRTAAKARHAGATARTVIGLSLLAGLGFGGYYVLIDRVAEGSVFWPIVTGRLVGLGALVAFLTVRGGPWLPAVGSRRLVTMAGVLDMGGTAFFILAAQSGRVDVAAVLSSLYPVGTIVLAALLLRERVRPMQAVGVVGAIVAIALIAAG
ncbi:MAG: DMT family transporter [Chloroflexota bacterium]|nr:DMT family transporter [Chloroflexota bacterium]